MQCLGVANRGAMRISLKHLKLNENSAWVIAHMLMMILCFQNCAEGDLNSSIEDAINTDNMLDLGSLSDLTLASANPTTTTTTINSLPTDPTLLIPLLNKECNDIIVAKDQMIAEFAARRSSFTYINGAVTGSGSRNFSNSNISSIFNLGADSLIDAWEISPLPISSVVGNTTFVPPSSRVRILNMSRITSVFSNPAESIPENRFIFSGRGNTDPTGVNGSWVNQIYSNDRDIWVYNSYIAMIDNSKVKLHSVNVLNFTATRGTTYNAGTVCSSSITGMAGVPGGNFVSSTIDAISGVNSGVFNLVDTNVNTISNIGPGVTINCYGRSIIRSQLQVSATLNNCPAGP